MEDPITVVNCPHCDELVEILSVGCAIFRHGVIKATGEQMNPHSNKEYCDSVVTNGLIYGCGKPFKLENIEGVWIAIDCDYV